MPLAPKEPCTECGKPTRMAGGVCYDCNAPYRAEYALRNYCQCGCGMPIRDAHRRTMAGLPHPSTTDR